MATISLYGPKLTSSSGLQAYTLFLDEMIRIFPIRDKSSEMPQKSLIMRHIWQLWATMGNLWPLWTRIWKNSSIWEIIWIYIDL